MHKNFQYKYIKYLYNKSVGVFFSFSSHYLNLKWTIKPRRNIGSHPILGTLSCSLVGEGQKHPF